MSKRANELREELTKELEQASLDYARILELSTALSQLDPKFVRFSVDASHLSRIGQELVAKKETALAEIIKNAYDADAVLVDLTFKRADSGPGGTLEVWDNGTGMSRQQLIDGFMRLSSPDKIDHPVSPLFHRSRAGRKGIGRFAVQRLGDKLTIVTQTKDASIALEVHFDWERFRAHNELSFISTEIRERSKTREQGTDLLIEGLREAWTDDDIGLAHRYIGELLQPFSLKASGASSASALGFEVAFHRETPKDILTIGNAETIFYRYCDAEVNGWVDDKGQAQWSIKSPKYLFPDADSPRLMKESYQYLKSVNCRAYYYIVDSSSKQARGFVRKLLDQNHGVRLYRNGFRVPPYGGEFDDWLGLDLSSRKRSLLVPHANLNFVGFVEVVDPTGKLFEETSSREGLIETPAFKELRDFVSKVLKVAAQTVAEARGTKVRASDSRPKSTTFSRAAASIAKDLGHLRGTITEAAAADEMRNIRARVIALGAQGDELLQENATIRVLASMGLTISEFTHEVEMGFVAVEADLNTLSELATLDADSKRRLSRVLERIGVLHSYIGYFETTTRDNVRRELRAIEMRDVLLSFETGIDAQKVREKLDLTVEAIGGELFTKPMHPSEWASILLNFFTNSIKAIRRAQVKGKILVRASRNGASIVLEFADNGAGIENEIKHRIFEPFFTTTSSTFYGDARDASLEGMGLGLSITRDIVESSGGRVELVDPPPDYTTCFRVEVPAATAEEISNAD